MYIDNVVRLYKNKLKTLVIPYVTFVLLIIPLIIFYSFYNSFNNDLYKSIQFDESLVKISGDTRSISGFNTYLRIKEEFTNQVVIPVVSTDKIINGSEIKVVGTTIEMFENDITLGDIYDGKQLIIGTPTLSSLGVVVNSSLARDYPIGSYIEIDQQKLLVEAIITDESEVYKLYIGYAIYDVFANVISQELENGSKVYHFHEIYLLDRSENVNAIVNKVEELLKGAGSHDLEILTKQSIFDSMIDQSSFNGDFIKIVFVLYLVIGLILIAQIINLSLRRRRVEFTVYRVVGQKKIYILFSSLLENMILVLFGSLISLFIGVVSSLVLLATLKLEVVLVSAQQITFIYISIIAFVIAFDIVAIEIKSLFKKII